MRFGVLAPMPSELRPVVRAFGLDDDTLTGTAGPHEVRAATTGIGIDLATAATTAMVDRGDVDHVVVVGIAGGLGSTSVGTLVVPEAVEDFPDARSYTPTPLGSLAGRGIIVSSDVFGHEAEVVAGFLARGVVAVDMETVAVAAVCSDRGVPWSAVRVVSDPADGPSANVDAIGLVNPDGTPNRGRALRFALRHPARLPALAKLGRDAAAAATKAANVARDAIADHPV